MTEATSESSVERRPAIFVGIDWADQKHFWSLAAPDGKIERGELEHKPEKLDEFFAGLSQRFAGQPIAVALEQSRGALVYALSKYSQVTIYPVHPNTLDHYRKSFYPSGAKSDPCDADLILDLARKHPERLRAFAPDTVATRTLQLLGEERRTQVDEQTALRNRLTAQLKMYFPQALDWFDVNQPVLGQLLLKWPSLDLLKRAKPAQVAKWMRKHRLNADRVEQLKSAIRTAIAATTDDAVIAAGSLTVTTLALQLAVKAESIAKFDDRLAALAETHPDTPIFASLPCAGPVMLPRLIAAFGTQRERFQSAAEVQCYAGIAPVTDASGKKKWVHWRWACPKFVRQTFHEWAWLSTRKSEWARAYYDRQREKGKSHHAAVRALAFKWIRIVFRCWKDRKPYDEAVYLKSLQKRAKPVESRRKTSSGLISTGELLA